MRSHGIPMQGKITWSVKSTDTVSGKLVLTAFAWNACINELMHECMAECMTDEWIYDRMQRANE